MMLLETFIEHPVLSLISVSLATILSTYLAELLFGDVAGLVEEIKQAISFDWFPIFNPRYRKAIIKLSVFALIYYGLVVALFRIGIQLS